jgi:hypothetical protein
VCVCAPTPGLFVHMNTTSFFVSVCCSTQPIAAHLLTTCGNDLYIIV